MEGVGDFCIDLDEEIFLRRQLLVAKLDALLDPSSEVLTDDAVGHVEDPLFLQSFPLEL